MRKYKEDEDKGFLCLDWNDDEPFSIYGREELAIFKILEVIIAPCNYLHKEVSEEGQAATAECISDPELQFEYLTSSPNMRYMYNSERLETNNFG